MIDDDDDGERDDDDDDDDGVFDEFLSFCSGICFLILLQYNVHCNVRIIFNSLYHCDWHRNVIFFSRQRPHCFFETDVSKVVVYFLLASNYDHYDSNSAHSVLNGCLKQQLKRRCSKRIILF